MSGCGLDGSDDFASTTCPRTEDFHSDSELTLDLIEGCRVLFSKVWQAADQTSYLALTQAINMGTYSSYETQQEILQSLLDCRSPRRGGKSLSTVIQYLSGKEGDKSVAPTKTSRLFSMPGEKSFLGRYSSSNHQWSFRGHWKLKNYSLSGAWFTGQPLSLFKKYLPTGLHDTVLMDNPASNDDLGLMRFERETSTSNAGIKFSTQPGTPVFGFTYSIRSFMRKAWAGLDWSYFPMNGAVLSTLALKHQLSDSLNCTVSIASGPNFEKPMAEGIIERVYKPRISAVYRYSNNLSFTANSQIKLGPSDPLVDTLSDAELSPEAYIKPYGRAALVRRMTGLTRLNGLIFSCGYDLTLSKIKLLAELSSDGQLKSVVHTANGLVYSGQIDWPRDSYKFGFGYEVALD